MNGKMKKLMALMLALSMCASCMSVGAFAAETETTENPDGTVTTTTTSTTTTEDGKTVVTVTFETKDEDGNLVASGGSEETSWTEEDSGEEPGQPEVTVPLDPGESASASATTERQFGDEPNGSDDKDYNYFETTTTDRTVTATTSEVKVTVNDASTGLVGEQESALKGLDPVYDENDNLHINPSDGQPLDKVNGEHVGKKDVFDRNYLSSKTLEYINVNGVSIWVDKGTKVIVDMVVPEGAELPEHELLDGKTIGSSVANWYKSNSFQKKLFPEGTEYKGGAKINDIANWYDEDGNLVLTIPEAGDFRYVGTGEHSKFYNARVTVIYEKDENGNTIYEDGKPVIKSIQKADGTPITIDGVPATELPENVSLEPIFDAYNGGRPTTFMLMDKDGNKVYAYCCDMETGANAGYWYTVSNLEDSDYYGSEESEEHIRSIVMNGYWGTSDVPKEDGTYETGSLESIKAGLREAINSGKMENETVQMPKVDAAGNPVVDDNGDPVMESKTMMELIDGLTEGEALLATQSAIWAYANGHVDALNGKDGVVVIDPDGYKWNHDPSANSKDGEALDDFGSARVDFLYNWLIDLETDEESSVVINEKNFVEDLSLTIGDLVDKKLSADGEGNQVENGVYEAALNFKLAFVPGENDDLLVQIQYTDLDGNQQTVVRRLAGENGEGQSYEDIAAADGVYTIEGLQLSENEEFNFDLRLEGTQYLEQGVYVYAPVGGRDVSQTFVGIAEGNRDVDVSMGVTIKFDVDENDKLSAKHFWGRTHNKPTPPVPPENPEDPQDPPADPPLVDIPEEEPPLVDIPEEEPPLVDIPEEEPPLVDIPEEEPPLVDIPDEEPPLTDVPKTGDMNVLWLGMSTLLSGGGLAGLLGLGRKGKEKE